MSKEYLKQVVIRPFNVISGIFIFSAFVMFVPVPITVISTISLKEMSVRVFVIVVVYTAVAVWAAWVLLSIVFKPKIVLNDEYMEIVHWENGLSYDKKHPFRLPKVQRHIINYSELVLFGGFFIKDIKEYIKKDSGFLKDKWMVATDAPIPVPIKLPKSTVDLRDVILFVKSDGQSFAADGGMYGIRQVEILLYKLEELTKIKSSGRVAPKNHVNSIFLNIARAMAEAAGLICWMAVIPVSVIWLESIINTAHIPAYESVWRTIYVISILLANLCLTGFMVSKKQKDDLELKKIRKIFGILSIILYLIFTAAFIISVLL